MTEASKNLLIVCPQEQKLKILTSLQTESSLHNIKFMTKEDYMKNFFFTYTEEAAFYLMKKYHWKYDVCNVYLKQLYVIDITKTYKNKKLNFLKQLKQELLQEKLLKFNPSFQDFIKSKQIIIKNYLDLDLYEEQALNTKLKFKVPNITAPVVECQTIEEEINYVCLEIIRLLKEGVDINKIYLTNITTEYLYSLKRIFAYYKIPLNIDMRYPLYSTNIVKTYLKENKIEETKENRVLAKKLVGVINSLAKINDGSAEYQEILISKLKQTYLTPSLVKNAVQIKDLYKENFTEEEHVFVLGFNQDALPKLKKDIDYISDKDKEEVALYSTEEVNKRAKAELIVTLSNIKNLHLSYKLASPFSTFYKSSVITDLKLEIIHPSEDKYQRSDIYNELRLAEKLDLYNLYKEKSPYLEELITHYKPSYRTYQNIFTGINKNAYLEQLPYPLKLSYTSLNTYNECNFKYYLTYVLKLSPYEDNFPAFIGSLYHKILELYQNSSFDFETEYQKYLEKRELTVKERLLLVRLKKELKELLLLLQEQNLLLGYNDYLKEQKLEIPLRKDIEVIFTGTIDKIMYYKKIEDTYFSIIDYKSGYIDTHIEPLKYGLAMQLPVYLYLIHHAKVFQNPIFTGIYYQNILFNYPTYDKTPIEKLKKDRIKLQGYSTEDISILSRFDSTYENSEVIKSMKYTDEKGFGPYTKILSDNTLYQLLMYTKKQIEIGTNNILEANFSINPKIYDGVNVACEFCKFKDICYCQEKDFVYLNKVKDLSFLDETGEGV